MADKPSFPPESGPKGGASGISGPAGFNSKMPKAGDLSAPTKHYPSTDAMVPKRANVIDGPGKGCGITGENGKKSSGYQKPGGGQ